MPPNNSMQPKALRAVADAKRWAGVRGGFYEPKEGHVRRHAFGWRSQPAITRIKQAVAEIRMVAKDDLVLAAEGAVTFLERLSPALERIDSSSGAIGTAVNKAIAGMGRPITAFPSTSSSILGRANRAVTGKYGS